jgi:hypothetical protein
MKLNITWRKILNQETLNESSTVKSSQTPNSSIFDGKELQST